MSGPFPSDGDGLACMMIFIVTVTVFFVGFPIFGLIVNRKVER